MFNEEVSVLNEGVFANVKKKIVANMQAKKEYKERVKVLKQNAKEEGKKFDFLLVTPEGVDAFIHALIVAIPSYNLKTLKAEIGHTDKNIESFQSSINGGKYSSMQKPLAVRMVKGFKKYKAELQKAEKTKS
jgi:hypothetical protein